MNWGDLERRAFAWYRNEINRMLAYSALAVVCAVASLTSFWLGGGEIGRIEMALFVLAGALLFLATLETASRAD